MLVHLGQMFDHFRRITLLQTSTAQFGIKLIYKQGGFGFSDAHNVALFKNYRERSFIWKDINCL